MDWIDRAGITFAADRIADCPARKSVASTVLQEHLALCRRQPELGLNAGCFSTRPPSSRIEPCRIWADCCAIACSRPKQGITQNGQRRKDIEASCNHRIESNAHPAGNKAKRDSVSWCDRCHSGAGQEAEEEVSVSTSSNRSIDKTQRVGITVIPLA